MMLFFSQCSQRFSCDLASNCWKIHKLFASLLSFYWHCFQGVSPKWGNRGEMPLALLVFASICFGKGLELSLDWGKCKAFNIIETLLIKCFQWKRIENLERVAFKCGLIERRNNLRNLFTCSASIKEETTFNVPFAICYFCMPATGDSRQKLGFHYSSEGLAMFVYGFGK